LSAYLPAGEAAGWARDGAPEEYEGEALYAYINGGAEIYHEYGFRRVVLQDYESPAGGAVSLEIFEMGTPEAAYGMFSFKRSGKGRTVPIGNGSELESYYLNFWKGRYLITLTGFDEEAATVEGLLAIGKAADARIRDSGAEPGLVKVLPAQGLKPGSVKYIRGLLGLNSLYPFPTARGLLFDEGVGGAYERGETLIVLEYGPSGDAEAARDELSGFLSGSDTYAEEDIESSEVRAFRDAKGRSVCLAGSGARLLIAVGPDRAACLELIGRAR
jgi:hypothetical protein